MTQMKVTRVMLAGVKTLSKRSKAWRQTQSQMIAQLEKKISILLETQGQKMKVSLSLLASIYRNMSK